MNLVTQIFAVLAGLFHVYVWVLESVLLPRPAVHRGVFGQRTEDLPAFRPWAFNIGFYNLFLAMAPLGGVLVYHLCNTTAGITLVAYGCAFMALAGVVLVASARDRWSAALIQSAPPTIALLGLLF